MNTTKILALVLATTLGGILASKLIAHRPAEPSAMPLPASPSAPPPAEPAITQLAPPVAAPKIPPTETSRPVQLANTDLVPVAQIKTPNASTGLPPKAAAPIQDPAARVALSLVGADPEAEQYWLAAIFDPSLPDHERADLMEDLNEDGLSDPKHPSAEDLVLIWNRLPPLEAAIAQADEFMLPHLLEAYKDLNHLLAGQPGQ
jgi:hypothetical protein